LFPKPFNIPDLTTLKKYSTKITKLLIISYHPFPTSSLLGSFFTSAVYSEIRFTGVTTCPVYTKLCIVRFEVFMAVRMTMMMVMVVVVVLAAVVVAVVIKMIWVLAQCRFVGRHQCFRQTQSPEDRACTMFLQNVGIYLST
jgi:hypothetical protein